MRKYLLLISLSVLFLAFQNCAKKNLENPSASSTNSVSSKEISKLSPADASHISIANSDELVMAAAGSSQYVIAANGLQQRLSKDQLLARQASLESSVFNYDIDLKTGIVRSYDVDDNEIQDKVACLTESDIDELKAILETAQLCKPALQAEGKVCTAIYKRPYAELQFPGSQIALGEATSGCDEGVDLCGAHKTLLKSFIKSMVVSLSSKKCDFQQ